MVNHCLYDIENYGKCWLLKPRGHMTICMYYTLFSHLLHLLCGWHVRHITLFIAMHIYIYIYIYIRVNDPSLNRNVGKYHLPHVWDEYISYARLVDSCNFQDPILWNHLSYCNEIYTCYKGMCVEHIN